MFVEHRFAAALLVAATMIAFPAAADDAGPFPYTAPSAGMVLVYDDGFEVAFGETTGRVTAARAGPKSAPRTAELEVEDSFMVRRIARRGRLLTVKNTVEGPGLWPLVPGATRTYRSEVSVDGTLRQTQNAVARFAKTVTALTLAGKTRRVIRVDVDVRWTSPQGKTGRVDIVYWYDLDLGYYVKRSYTRYGPEGRPRTPAVRTLALVRSAASYRTR